MLTRLARLPKARLFFPRTLATTHPSAPPVPWFVDQQYESSRQPPPHLKSQPTPPTTTTPTTTKTTTKTNPVPENAPDPVKLVHAVLARSPHLDQSALLTTHAIAPQPGPPLPLKAPQGRRKRGSTYGGDSAYDVPGTIWSWTVIAQVKEGTENRGAVESVIRVVRKTLATIEPPLPLPPKSKRRMGNGWAMVDAGDFAVHVLSREAREKYFGQDRFDVW